MSTVKKSCVIVVPVYSSVLKDYEIASFRQTLKVFGGYRDISLLTYPELDLSLYHRIAKTEGASFNCNYFDKSYFSGLESYTRLCLLRTLYKSYTKYDYMLVCQLDAWVFKDDLDIWMNEDYDYIGTPWYVQLNKDDWDPSRLTIVGNGGFSLRRIQRFIDILDPWYVLKSRTIIKKGEIKRYVKTLIRHFILIHCPKVWRRINQYSEDLIFCVRLRGTEMELSTPSPERALLFSFEHCPSYSYERTGHKLPMGCHAFQKHEFDSFWSKFIVL